jgi:retron-type reverse transcriptase
MRRHGGLWDRLVSFPNLLQAARQAARGKRHRFNAANFEFHRERELCRLQEELRRHAWVPGPYHTFTIRRPKPRLISAAPFRDRVVDHALCNVLTPIFEPTFIHDSYACRRGEGTHAAVDRFTAFARRHRYVLQCDVSKYFPSVDHRLLEEQIARKVKDTDVLRLVQQIIDHSNPQEPVQEWFPGDDLFTPASRRRGLPLGNQTSQFFANVYLDPFDHFVKEALRVRCYLRYCDDFVLLGDDTARLADLRQRCREELARWRLRLHPRKAVISRVQDGTRWLGYRVFPTHRLLPRANVVGMQRRLRRLQAGYRAGQLTGVEVCRSLAGWLGHAARADTWRLRTWLFAGVRGERVAPPSSP